MRALRVLGLGQMPNYRGALAYAGARLRLVAGAEDAKFVALARGLVAAFPSTRLELVPGVGHNVLLEAPEHLASLLLQGSEGAARAPGAAA
jgi:2-succinyl-6-hydroxy-2,4-cyclohexadiene-1-carboxylate synthase